jgi:hypothetical protein
MQRKVKKKLYRKAQRRENHLHFKQCINVISLTNTVQQMKKS